MTTTDLRQKLIDSISVTSAVCIALVLASPVLSGAVEERDIAARLQRMPHSHPRLFLAAKDDHLLARKLSGDPIRVALRQEILAKADEALSAAPVERIVVGRRLLSQSRKCFGRVLFLGLAWKLTGHRKYAERAEREMLAAAAFSDWNPSHFLDAGEMTAALGAGYDWFHSFLSESSRIAIRTAIVEKGLKPSLTHDDWIRATTNWNPVCNAGLTVGALAVAKSEPSLAARIITRAINTVPRAMQEYAPDGAYPEGTSYWAYGTTFNLILVSALESALETDFGLSQLPGFLHTADYWLHVSGPTGLSFNYSDNFGSEEVPAPAMFWFAARRREPSLLWTEYRKLESLAAGKLHLTGDRLEAFLPLWMPDSLTRPFRVPPLAWTGRGPTPVALRRTGWTDPNAVFVAIKGGSASVSHAHMDAGAFVIDADGYRWADDLGAQDYHSLESTGINLWERAQGSPRWKVFRLSTAAHNVLMVDGKQQRVDGKATLVLSRDGSAIVDTSEVYAGQLASAKRGVQLRPDRTVLVQDEIRAPAADAVDIRWAMLTKADIIIHGPGRATLRQGDRTLSFHVVEPAAVELQVYATDPPPAPYDAPNPGTRIIGFRIKTPAGKEERIVVRLMPASANPAKLETRPLSAWD